MDPQHHVRLDSISEQALIEYAQGTGVAAKVAKKRLLEKYEPLMERLVREAGTSPELREDALQAARLGFLEALVRFDSSFGFRLSGFARQHIWGRVLRAVYVDVRRGIPNQQASASGETEDSDGEFVHLVSLEVGLERGPMIEQLMLDDVERGHEQIEEFERVEEDRDNSVIQEPVRRFVERLSAHQQYVVRRVFYANMSQAAVARELGVSREAVRRTLMRVFERGRGELGWFGEQLAA